MDPGADRAVSCGLADVRCRVAGRDHLAGDLLGDRLRGDADVVREP